MNAADLQTEEAINLAHPFGVARREIVIYRNHINAASGQSVQVYRQGRHQRLAFAGPHLGDLALMQHESADHLHIKMPHPGGAHTGLAHQRESFRQNFVQDFLLAIFPIVFVARILDRIRNLGLKESRALAQLFIGKFLNLRFELVYLGDARTNALQKPLVAAAENCG